MVNDFSTVQAWAEAAYWSSLGVLGCLYVPILFNTKWEQQRLFRVTSGVVSVIAIAAFLTAVVVRFVG